MKTDDTIRDTMEHRAYVRRAVKGVISDLIERAALHDQSKMEEPELSCFSEWGPKLKTLEYGSPEYKAALEQMGPALEHHYESNRHHPEHFIDGVNGMNLVDLVEMVCDWYAATKRMKDGGDFKDSVMINAKRFGFSGALHDILINSVPLLEGYDDEG